MIFAIFSGVGFDLLYRARNLSICDVVFCCGTVFCAVFSIGVIFVIVCGVCVFIAYSSELLPCLYNVSCSNLSYAIWNSLSC